MTPGCPIAEVGDVVGLSERQLRRMSDEGELPTLIDDRSGGLRVPLRSVQDLLARMSPNGLSTTDSFPRLFSVARAAERLDVSKKTIRRLIEAGELGAYQLARPKNGKRGSALRIPESELLALLKRGRRLEKPKKENGNMTEEAREPDVSEIYVEGGRR